MKKLVRRAIALVLMLSMVLGVSGCSGCGSKSKNEATIDKNTIYREELLNIDFPTNCYINGFAICGNKLFYSGYTYDEVNYDSKYFVGVSNTDGSDFHMNTINSDSEKTSMYVEGLYSLTKDKVLMVYSEYFEDDSDPDNYVWESKYYLALLDENGNIASKVDLSEEANIGYAERFIPLSDGSFIIYSNNTFYKFDSDMKVVTSKEISDNIYVNSCFAIDDNTLCASYWGDDGETYKKIDVNTLEMKDDMSFPFAVNNYSVLPGNKDYGILLRSSSSIYGYNFGDSEIKEVMNLVNSDINTTYFDAFYSLEDGSFIGYYSDYSDEKSKTVVAKYTKINPEDYVEKQILTLGCVYLDSDIRTQVIKFNKSNDKYRITIKDYSVYNTDDNYSAGYEKLNSDIASGQLPDIIISNASSTINNYSAKGLFADLHKFLDNDDVIDKNDLWPNLITNCEKDGKLYSLVPSFYVQTLVGKQSLLGNRTGWTIEEMKAFEDSLPDGMKLFESGLTKENFVNMMLYVQAEDLIDAAKGKCYFDSENFKSILRYAASLPESDDNSFDEEYYNDYSSQWRDGRTAIYNWYIAEPSSYQEVMQGYFDEDITIVGYPSSDGSNGSFMTYYSSFAISAKSKNQQGAWEFIRTFWGKDYQSTLSWGIPASMSAFNEYAKKSMERPSYTDDTGAIIYYDNTIWMGETEITLDPLTQEDVDKLTAFIKSVSRVSGDVDEDIRDIITDECKSFFSGQKSVDEVTNIIQNRVSTLLKERQ